jgi:hypothetical protein
LETFFLAQAACTAEPAVTAEIAKAAAGELWRQLRSRRRRQTSSGDNWATLAAEAARVSLPWRPPGRLRPGDYWTTLDMVAARRPYKQRLEGKLLDRGHSKASVAEAFGEL